MSSTQRNTLTEIANLNTELQLATYKLLNAKDSADILTHTFAIKRLTDAQTDRLKALQLETNSNE